MANRETPIQELLKIGQQWHTTCDIAIYLMNYKYQSLEKTLEKYNFFYKELKPQYVDYQNKLDSKITDYIDSIEKLTKRINQLEIDEQTGSTEEITTNIIRLNQRLQEKQDKLRELNELKYELSLMINTLNGYEIIFINRLNFIEPIEQFKKLIEDTQKENPDITDITKILFIIFKNKPLELLPPDMKTYVITTDQYNINNNYLYSYIFLIIQKVRREREDSEESKGDVEERESKDEESKDEESKDEEYVKREFLKIVNKSINKNTTKSFIISLIRTLLNLDFITNETDLKNIIKTYYKKTNTTLSLSFPYNISKLNEETNNFYEFIIRDYNFDKDMFEYGITIGKNNYMIDDHYFDDHNLDDQMLYNYYIGNSRGISSYIIINFINELFNIDNGFINKTDVDGECKEYVVSKEPETLDAIVSPDFGRDIGPERSPSIASYGPVDVSDSRDFVPDSYEAGGEDAAGGAGGEGAARVLDFGDVESVDGDGASESKGVEDNVVGSDAGSDAGSVAESDAGSVAESDAGSVARVLDFEEKKYYKKYLKYKRKYLMLKHKL